jgi:hypothetical protein
VNEKFFHNMVQVDSIFHGRGHVGIKINDQVSSNFQTRKGVRQEDPLSPILFNIIVDVSNSYQ